MNNKAFINAAFVIFGFAFVTMFFIFYSVLIYEIGDDYIINITTGEAQNILNSTIGPNSSSLAQAIILQQEYKDFTWPYDLSFLALLLFTFTSTLRIAFLAKKNGIFSFFGYLFVGTMLILLLTTYANQIVTWFMTEIYDKVFSDTTVAIPMLEWYLDNLGIVNFVWWLSLLGVNLMDKSFLSKTGRIEE